MFIHKKELQYHAKPDKSDPLMARKLQEILGGQYGEMTVATQYLFQGWNTRGNGKYKDLILDTGAEEIGHVEMIATMIAHLLEDAPVDAQENAFESDPAIAAVMGGMDLQHAIVTGIGPSAKDSNGVPWSGSYITSSGNLLADMRSNINAESQGRLQVARLYHMTNDAGVRDMLGFLLARDTMHQNQWIKAARELEAAEGIIVPSGVSEWEIQDVNHILYNFSEGEDSKPFATGEAPDGGKFIYKDMPEVMGEKPVLKPAPPSLYNTVDMDAKK